MKHPIQPLVKDKQGVLRFKPNAIVKHLLEIGQQYGVGLNELARHGFSNDDWRQFAQLIGYSLSGYSELSYVDGYSYGVAASMDDGKRESEARIEYLEAEIAALRNSIREPMARLFEIHPDDLKL